jgi:hypothetical protein
MCERLGGLRAAMSAWVGALSPALLSTSEAEAALADVTAVEHMAATARVLPAARVAEGASWRRAGARSPAEHIAKKTGASTGGVLESLKLAERLAELPEVESAARAGELSPRQAAAVASAAVVAPEESARLVDDARRLPLRELEAECGRTRAARVDREAVRRRHHRERSLRSWTDAEGAGHIHAKGTADDVARIMAGVTAERDRVFRAARAAGREEPGEAYAFDALSNLCCGTAGGGAGATRRTVGTKVIIRCDLDSLLRGYPVDGETCEVAGVPVAVSAVEDALASGSAFIAAVLTRAEQLVGFVHLGRRPTAGQQTGLEWIHPTCAVEGCGQSARLQRDHRVDWARSKVTMFELLDLLCAFHHGLKTTKGWALVDGRGKRPFVAPEDPRHPRPPGCRAHPPHAPPDAA